MDVFSSEAARKRARSLRPTRLLRDETGGAAVEFAMVLPVLCLLLFGIVKFGIVLNNYVQLTNAAAAGARQLAISRGASTPYTDTTSAIGAASPNLTTANIVKTLTVKQADGTLVSCTSGSCPASAFGDGTASPPLQATATLTYPCDLTVYNLVKTCSLSATSAGAVQ